MCRFACYKEILIPLFFWKFWPFWPLNDLVVEDKGVDVHICELCLLSNNLCINAHLAIYYVDHCQVIAEGVICELAHFFLHLKVISEGNYAKYLKNLRNTFMY